MLIHGITKTDCFSSNGNDASSLVMTHCCFVSSRAGRLPQHPDGQPASTHFQKVLPEVTSSRMSGRLVAARTRANQLNVCISKLKSCRYQSEGSVGADGRLSLWGCVGGQEAPPLTWSKIYSCCRSGKFHSFDSWQSDRSRCSTNHSANHKTIKKSLFIR